MLGREMVICGDDKPIMEHEWLDQALDTADGLSRLAVGHDVQNFRRLALRRLSVMP